jgi:hypothetical protein
MKGERRRTTKSVVQWRRGRRRRKRSIDTHVT